MFGHSGEGMEQLRTLGQPVADPFSHGERRALNELPIRTMRVGQSCLALMVPCSLTDLMVWEREAAGSTRLDFNSLLPSPDYVYLTFVSNSQYWESAYAI